MSQKTRTYHIRVSEELAVKMEKYAQGFGTMNAALNYAISQTMNGVTPTAIKMDEAKRSIDANSVMISTALLFIGGAYTGRLSLLLLSFFACSAFLYIITKKD